MSTALEQPETRTFAAETSRVLQLMIHALYTNRDIFLRELVSNASDACDKLRYEAQQNQSLLGDAPELTVHLSFDVKARTLTVADTGMGMNREDLITHLGTIAKSGTAEFLKQMSGDTTKDVNLIGQFGVGFYSAFMVADRVQVVSRKAGESEGWQWESDGQGSFTIASAAQAAARGTTITLHLKSDAKEYADRHRLGHIISTYSDHIRFPITLTDSEGVVHTLNDGSAIWTRPKNEISEEQYQHFYHDVSHSPEKPWAVLHHKAEGKTEYTSLLFIPGMKPFDLFHPERSSRVKLYVKRVFIADEGIALIPPYLRFLRGVVDSADLPLNISRETLQKSPVLDKIRESVTSKVLSELKKRAEKDAGAYADFWQHFGAVLKEGLCEANAPREKILDACRFYSSEGGDALVGLADYRSRMKEGQEAVYFLTGDSLEALRRSPQIEGFRARGIEVLLLSDHVDDFWPNVTMKYGELALRSVTKSGEDLEKFPRTDGMPPADEDATTSDVIAQLCTTMQTLYGDAVSEVCTTRKLADTPICLGVAHGAMDARMERFLIEHKQLHGRAAKRIEINPSHPVITALAAQIATHGLNATTEDALWLLYDQALIAEGETIPDASAFARRLSSFLARGMAA